MTLPPEFNATLFACDPFIEYPSALALGPERGSIFVAVDYMTGLGKNIIRRDEIRLLQDIDNDGYADKSTLYAKGFNSIMGLAFHDSVVYVMHAPFLTSLRDTDGDGKADQRRDLLAGLGLPPEKNPVRLHCANGVVMGHDGWLYLALGDHGCNVARPEGDRLILNGGGILRCRPDGSDLHVFATGLRNIYDVALDAELNVFVRDNENDGGQYMVRVCHSFFGADHGYPYLYYERPDEVLAPLADLGRGSSAGGVCYLESSFPAKYRGNLFFCEWGRSVVHYRPKHLGSGFARLKEYSFAAGAATDPYGFKPTDLVVDYDGALYVSDWADGQRPKRGRGRIYRITSKNANKPQRLQEKKSSPGRWIAQLDSSSYLQRVEAQTHVLRNSPKMLPLLRKSLQEAQLGEEGRLHAVWLLALGEKHKALPLLFQIAETDPAPQVRVQAVRAIADLTDPVLTEHRLNADPGPATTAKQLAALAPGQAPPVRLEIVVALGRLQWSGAPKWLCKHFTELDSALAHAAMQTMRRSKNWAEILSILDRPDSDPLRKIALRALGNQYEPVIVDGLIKRLTREANPARRRDYAGALTRVCKMPKPWVYWGYRPPPRPANSVSWDKTDDIARALDKAILESDFSVRHQILRRMRREDIPVPFTTLSRWLTKDRDTKRVEAVLDVLSEYSIKFTGPALTALIRENTYSDANRLYALRLLDEGLDEEHSRELLNLAAALEDGAVLAATLRYLGQRPHLNPVPLLLDKLKSSVAVVRSAAIESLAERRAIEATPHLQRLLHDKDNQVRRSAVLALGQLKVQSAADPIVQLAKGDNLELVAACLDALRLLKDDRAISVAVESLNATTSQLAALRYLQALGGPEQAKAVADLAMRTSSTEILQPALRMLSDCSNEYPAESGKMEELIACVQGASGVLYRWRRTGPLHAKAIPPLIKKLARSQKAMLPANAPDWQTIFASGVDGRLLLPPHLVFPRKQWLAFSDVNIQTPQEVQVLASAEGKFRVWVNNRLVYQRKKTGIYRPDSDRFNLSLDKSAHRFIIALPSAKKPTRFHLRFRRKSSTAQHEKLIQFALSRTGSKWRGREVFLDVKKSQCLKCHRLGNRGEQIGPDLSGIGKRFSRIHIIESILDPSRSIAPSYETLLIELKDGRIISGAKIAESPNSLVLGDKDGKKHTIDPNDVETRAIQNQSIMPTGLERQFSQQEFIDLVAFLESEK